MTQRMGRRELLAGAGSAAVCAFLPATSAFAQTRRGPFGLPIPAEVQALLPQDALGVASVVENILAMEGQADVLRLPRSALQIGNLSSLIGIGDEALYSAALPRLVALIDRAGGQRGRALGDRAGALLAQLNASERRVPEALIPIPDEEGLPPLDFPGTQDPADPPAEAPPIEGAGGNAPAASPIIPRATALRRSTRFEELAEEYRALFDSAALRDERRETAEWHVTMLRRSRDRYARVEDRTGVPWYFVGATHGLEASFNFRAHLHNGDFPLTTRTRQVPAGRPSTWLPPSDWESSAIDALRHMGFAGQSDWSLPRTLYRLEAYNGFGYRRRSTPTPYLWSYSQHYDRGKFIADGRWSATARSQQCGAAIMLKMLANAGDIRFD